MTLIVALIVMFVLLALIVLGRAAIRSARHVLADSEGLETLRRRGVDMNRPCKFDFHLHFANREVAVAAAEAISAAGYQTHVSAGEHAAASIVCVSQSLLPTEPELRASRRRLAELARPFNGRYQAWFCDNP